MSQVVKPVVDERFAVSQMHGPSFMEPETPPLQQAEPRWMRMAIDPTLVREARRYAAAVLSRADIGEERLVGDVRLVVSELVTNAMRAAERFARARGIPWAPYERPVALRVECRPAWVHLFVIDPDPQMAEPKARDVLDEGGRGIAIVEAVGALHWHVSGTYGKTVHAVVPRSAAKLTDREVDQLLRRAIL